MDTREAAQPSGGAGELANRQATKEISRMVGREREIALIDDLLESGGRPAPVLFITGEAGIGKSRLLHEAAERARRRGWLALGGMARDMDGMPAYLPFVEVIRKHLDQSSDEVLETFAAGAPELCRLLPEIGRRLGTVPDATTLDPESERFRLFESVTRFLTTLAAKSEATGLVVLLDDLQWADKPTLLLLQHVCRGAGDRFVLVATFRTNGLEPGHALFGVVADLTREGLCNRLDLQPLEVDCIGRLIEGMSGRAPSPGLAAGIHRQTEGNPFFAEAVVRDLIARGADLDEPAPAEMEVPADLRTVIRRQLSVLRPATQELLRSAAALGDTFEFDLLAASSGLEAPEMTRAIEEADLAGVVRPQAESYAFVHALIRRTIYDDLSVPRRRGIHRRVAEAMEASPAASARQEWGIFAHHWLTAGVPEKATWYFLRAGEAAVNVAAWEEASRHWRAALDCMERSGEPPRRMARLLEGIGDLDFLSSFEVQACVASYDRAARLYEAAGDHVGAGRALSRAGRSLAYPTSGLDWSAALDYLRSAEALLSGASDSIELGELYTALGHAESHQLRGEPDEILEWIVRLQGIAEKLNSDYLRIGACSLEGHYRGIRGELARGLELEERACAWARAEHSFAANDWQEKWHEYLLDYSDASGTSVDDVGSYQVSRFVMRNYAIVCCGVQSLDLLDPVEAKRKHDLVSDALIYLFYDYFFTGDLAALRLAVEKCTIPVQLPTGMNLLSLAAGDWRSCADGYASRVAFWRAAGSTYAQFLAYRILLRVLRVQQDAAGAQSVAEDWLATAVRARAVKFEIPARAELALVLVERNRTTEAARHLERCREIFQLGEDWRGIGGRAQLAEAALAAADGRCDEADAQFASAVATFRELSLPWDEAEAYEVWARACRRFRRSRNRQVFVTEKLGSARALYQRIGAGQPWLDRLDAEEARLAVILTGTPLAGMPDGLSAREAQVLSSVAAGHTNQEIADELVISLNTVARHMAHIFEKTGVANRAEAAVYAMRNGLND